MRMKPLMESSPEISRHDHPNAQALISKSTTTTTSTRHRFDGENVCFDGEMWVDAIGTRP